MLTEAVAQALQVCGRQMIQGSAEAQQYEHEASAQLWGFNKAYDNVVGTLVCA